MHMFSSHLRFALDCHGGSATFEDLLLDFDIDSLVVALLVLEEIEEVAVVDDTVYLLEVCDRPTRECEPYMEAIAS